jgi:hypothetical protein
MLSTIGYAAVPADVVLRADRGDALNAAESQMLAGHPDFAARLLSPIPRMEEVVSLIAALHGRAAIPPGLERHVEVLKLADVITGQLLAAKDLETLIQGMRTEGTHDPSLLDSLAPAPAAGQLVSATLLLAELRSGMTLTQDVYSDSQVLLAGVDTVLTENLLERLKNFAETAGVHEPIAVQYETAVT